MKNTYLTSYFPLLAIILFSLSLAIRTEMIVLEFLQNAGIYEGMLEFFSEKGVKLSLLVLLLLLFFMIFSALKLIADTINGLALLFFSKDFDGESLKNTRGGSAIYFTGSVISLFTMFSFQGIGLVFVATTVFYLMYFVYKASTALSVTGLIGMIFFEVITWSSLLTGIIYLAIRVYNSMVASLPI